MESMADRLLRTAAMSRTFLNEEARDKVFDFIMARQNSDGGFRGRGAESDLYYTLFSVAVLKILDRVVPVFKVWKYVRSFGAGRDLDLVHLTCLIRLRLAFPLPPWTRKRLFRVLEQRREESVYGRFLTLMAFDKWTLDPNFTVAADAPTPNLAAAALLNPTDGLAAALLGRFVKSGGFSPSAKVGAADLLSTATAVFALVYLKTNLDTVQRETFKYVESLWRESGGFAGHLADEFEDAEYTFYALLAMGCLIQSMAPDYGN